MTFKTVLKLQMIWAVLGIAYNGASLLKLSQSQTAFSPTDPMVGLVFMATGTAIIMLGFQGLIKVYIPLAAILAIMLAYSGVYLHAAAFTASPDLAGYASTGSWAAAILINVYGVLMLLAGVVLALQKTKAAS